VNLTFTALDIVSLVINDQFHSYWYCLKEADRKAWIGDEDDDDRQQGGEKNQEDKKSRTKKLAAGDPQDASPQLEILSTGDPEDLADSEELKEKYNAALKKYQQSDKDPDCKFKVYFRRKIQESIMYAHTLFQSPDFFCDHVEEVERLKKLLHTIVAKARLPSKEPLEGLRVLRSAWDVFDIGQSNLRSYKFMSKAIYLFLLASGIATVCLTVFTDSIDAALGDLDSSMTPTASIIFYLSVASTFVTALNAYVNPSARWRQIRDSTRHLESSIWQYRTRTGPYKMQGHGLDRAADLLKNEVVHAVETLIGGSDIGQSTSWTREYPTSVFRHGQRKPKRKESGAFGVCCARFLGRMSRAKVSPAGATGVVKDREQITSKPAQPKSKGPKETATQPARPERTEQQQDHENQENDDKDRDNDAEEDEEEDDHHSPLTPEQYIKFRLRIAEAFYKRRLPANTRSRNLFSVTVMSLSATGTILAYQQLSDYVSICASVAAAITSWMEYSNTATKIGRYNGAASGIESLILWWSSLPEVEKSIVTRIDDLVSRGEQVPSRIHPPFKCLKSLLESVTVCSHGVIVHHCTCHRKMKLESSFISSENET
jgi:hypothetical protein